MGGLPVGVNIDRKYGKLTLLHRARAGGQGVGAVWRAVCDCGNTREVLLRKVRSGAVKSCGNCTKGLGIQGSGRVVRQGIPKGHRDSFSRLIRKKPGQPVTAGSYMDITRLRCIACNTSEVTVEWADPNIESSTELIPICKTCSHYRRGANISTWLGWLIRTARKLEGKLSSNPG